MQGSQNSYFADGGGDEYFRRNHKGNSAPSPSLPGIELIRTTGVDALIPVGWAAVLGGSGGHRAAALALELPAWNISSVDISSEAIASGRELFPHITHHCLDLCDVGPRLVDVIPEQDLIVLPSVLPWVDRAQLSRAVANIDETLLDGGLLMISDFLPPTRRKNPIKHAPGFFTYKQDYSEPFLSLGIYETVAVSARVAKEPADIDAQERRIASHLLRKNLTGLYPIGYSG